MKDPAKLTLRLERDVIEAAKRYAAAHGTSVSKLVEGQLRQLACPPVEEPEPDWMKDLSPEVRKILGMARPRPGVQPVDEEDYWRYLEEKHR